MIRHPCVQHPGKVLADQFLLLMRQLQRIRIGQVAGDVCRQRLGGTAARCKEQHRPQSLGKRLGRKPWPVSSNARRHIVVKHAGIHLLERHRAFIVPDPLGITAEPLKPCNYVLGIGHAAAEHE